MKVKSAEFSGDDTNAKSLSTKPASACLSKWKPHDPRTSSSLWQLWLEFLRLPPSLSQVLSAALGLSFLPHIHLPTKSWEHKDMSNNRSRRRECDERIRIREGEKKAKKIYSGFLPQISTHVQTHCFNTYVGALNAFMVPKTGTFWSLDVSVPCV